MTLPSPARSTEPSPGKDRAAGGVVVHPDGLRVLLRRPTPNPGFDDLEWTHAKGRLEGQAPREAALREAREELGVEAEVVGEIPGWFEGSYTTTQYFVLRWIRDVGPHDDETAELRWATWDDASALIRRGRSAIGKARDLAVLHEARTRSRGETSPL